VSFLETKIIRNDTGLDFKRIEQIIKMFHSKSDKQSEIIRRKKSAELKQREANAFQHFELNGFQQEIDRINKLIESLETERKEYERRIRDFTQGTEKDKRYNSFESIREGSPIHNYVNQNSGEYSEKEKVLREMKEQFSEELWIAKDIGQAVDIYNNYVSILQSFEE
jgi:hypothetical protein